MYPSYHMHSGGVIEGVASRSHLRSILLIGYLLRCRNVWLQHIYLISCILKPVRRGENLFIRTESMQNIPDDTVSEIARGQPLLRVKASKSGRAKKGVGNHMHTTQFNI